MHFILKYAIKFFSVKMLRQAEKGYVPDNLTFFDFSLKFLLFLPIIQMWIFVLSAEILFIVTVIFSSL